jgi:hypothetical protein
MCSLSFNGGLFDQHAQLRKKEKPLSRKKISTLTPGEVPVGVRPQLHHVMESLVVSASIGDKVAFHFNVVSAAWSSLAGGQNGRDFAPSKRTVGAAEKGQATSISSDRFPESARLEISASRNFSISCPLAPLIQAKLSA